MKIRPLHDRLIVKRLEEERKTASGIVIPDTATEKPDQGEVKAIGKGKIMEDGTVRAKSARDEASVPSEQAGGATPLLDTLRTCLGCRR